MSLQIRAESVESVFGRMLSLSLSLFSLSLSLSLSFLSLLSLCFLFSYIALAVLAAQALAEQADFKLDVILRALHDARQAQSDHNQNLKR